MSPPAMLPNVQPNMYPNVLPVGHRLRRSVARALLLTGISTAVFVVFAGLTTQVASVRSGTPWQDDPYRTVLSCTELFVPGLAVLICARMLLCRRAEPLPLARIDQLLRAAGAIGFLVGLTVATDLVALALHADRRLWNGSTPVSVVALAVLAGVTALSALVVRRTHRSVRREYAVRDDGTDWLGELPLLADRLTAWWPPRRRRAVLAVADRLSRWPTLPRHLPAVVVGGSVLVVGAAPAGVQALTEKLPVALFAFDALVLVGSTVAFLAIANRYLRLVAVPRPATPFRRAARLSLVVGCLALPVATGLRDPLWRGLGLGPQVRTPDQLYAVTLGGGALTTLVVFLAAAATGRRS